MKYAIPILISNEDSKGLRCVHIPCINGYTQGTSLYNCIEMAEDYVQNYYNEKLEMPNEIEEVNTSDEFPTSYLLQFDTM